MCGPPKPAEPGPEQGPGGGFEALLLALREQHHRDVAAGAAEALRDVRRLAGERDALAEELRQRQGPSAGGERRKTKLKPLLVGLQKEPPSPEAAPAPLGRSPTESSFSPLLPLPAAVGEGDFSSALSPTSSEFGECRIVVSVGTGGGEALDLPGLLPPAPGCLPPCETLVPSSSFFQSDFQTERSETRQPERSETHPGRTSFRRSTKSRTFLQEALQVNARNVEHLRHVLGVTRESQPVTAQCLFEIISDRRKDDQVSLQDVEDTLEELALVACTKPSASRLFSAEDQIPEDGNWIPFGHLASALANPELPALIREDVQESVRKVVSALLQLSLEELIDAATRGSGSSEKDTAVEEAVLRRRLLRKRVNIMVSVVVVLNLLVMGVSLDLAPGSPVWLVIETLCVMVFMMELIYKIWDLGWREYFQGEGWRWNCADMLITLMALSELFLSFVEEVFAASMGTKATPAIRIAVTMRALRVVRVVRFLKLVNSPLLRDLSKMLSGFVIGLPSLFWVVILIAIVLYIIAIVFRISFGPDPGQDLISKCGRGDDYLELFDKDCPVHWMYGEEFFGTVQDAMFTSFRFMVGDFSSRGGKSIVVAFSQGFGKDFQTVFVIFMISVLFGLFNIITAIFVDATQSGLQANDKQRKYMLQYEKAFVRKKLRHLIKRINQLNNPGVEPEVAGEIPADWSIGLEEFVAAMHDRELQTIMSDLDIQAMHPETLFNSISSEGRLSAEDLLRSVLKLRGSPDKADFIACWTTTRALHGKVDKLLSICSTSSAVLNKSE